MTVDAGLTRPLEDARPFEDVRGRVSRLEIAALVALVGVAALLRFVSLPARGMWDADQGTEMLVLLGLVRDHVVPLLGPQTSIGGFHHGVLYYWLLAPAALVSDADPTAVAAELALLATLAVVPIWWLARSVAGSWLAGGAAALLYAVSATAIAAATEIWNPSLVALPASLALAGAWHGATSGRERGWLVGAAGLAVTIHAHVLGAVLAVPILGLFVAARRVPPLARPRWRTLGAGAAIVAVTWIPLLVRDAGNDWTELRALASFVTAPLTGGATGGTGTGFGLGLVAHALLVAIRVVGWPLTGLVTLGPAAPLPALLAGALVATGLATLATSPDPRARVAAWWLGLTLAWSILALTIAAPSLQTVVPGLPVDQYHAWVDPVVLVLAGVGLAGLLAKILDSSGRPATDRERAAVRVVGLVGVVAALALVGWNVAHWPPTTSPDGGWPAADAAAGRIASDLDPIGTTVPIVSLPVFKPADAYAFPLVRRGIAIADQPIEGFAPGEPVGRFGSLVVVCDERFREAIGADCGGPAEDAVAAGLGSNPRSVDRFEAAPGRWISVYRAP